MVGLHHQEGPAGLPRAHRSAYPRGRRVTAWARSAYGTNVVLGPTQEAVYRWAVRHTAHGRRPEVTLARIAADTGKPVSSVHVALGRLRALGLVGVAARMGRTGGHRLWRVTSGVMGALDVARHKRAVSRILHRWRTAATGPTVYATDAGPVPSRPGPVPVPPPERGQSDFDRLVRQGGRLPWDPMEVGPDATDVDSAPGPSTGPGGKRPDDSLPMAIAGRR